MRARRAVAGSIVLLAALCAGPARAQTLTDEEIRLMEVHSLLLDLPPVQAPAALDRGTLDLSLEAVTIPFISGDAGPYHEITASDHTRIFPRPRVMLGLPAPQGFRAFVGASYIPPIQVFHVSTNYLAAEGGMGIAPGSFRLGLRLHGLYAVSKAPVTEPNTDDVLKTGEYGADLAAGVQLGHGRTRYEPYAGVGVVSFQSRFHVTVDGTDLRRDGTSAVLQGGLRLVFGGGWETVAEVDSYPGRLTHAEFRLGYLFGR